MTAMRGEGFNGEWFPTVSPTSFSVARSVRRDEPADEAGSASGSSGTGGGGPVYFRLHDVPTWALNYADSSPFLGKHVVVFTFDASDPRSLTERALAHWAPRARYFAGFGCQDETQVVGAVPGIVAAGQGAQAGRGPATAGGGAGPDSLGPRAMGFVLVGLENRSSGHRSHPHIDTICESTEVPFVVGAVDREPDALAETVFELIVHAWDNRRDNPYMRLPGGEIPADIASKAEEEASKAALAKRASELVDPATLMTPRSETSIEQMDPQVRHEQQAKLGVRSACFVPV